MYSLPGVVRRAVVPKRSKALSERPIARKPQPETILAPQIPPSSGPSPRTVRIIGADNGMGLSRDREFIAGAFLDAGWDVSFADPKDKEAAEPRAVNVHLEVLAQRYLHAAQTNIIVPNPEWWLTDWNPLIRRPKTVIWAKTEDAARIFKGFGAQVEFVGFRSADRQDQSVPRERAFLHIGGKSPNKGTALLVGSWRAEYPRLIVVTSQPIRSSLPNVVIIRRRISDQEVGRLQNECQFHIYPSHYEGFGHAQWEGLSCGAIVFATDGPPFSEHADAFRLLGAKPVKRGAVTRHDVMPVSVASAVKWAMGLIDAEVKQHSEGARESWERNTTAFQGRIAEIIAGLAGPRESVEAPAPPLVYPANSELPAFAYVGRIDCVTGQGAAARHQLHVLRSHGLRFKVIDAGSCASPDPSERDPFVQAARRSDEGTDKPRGTIFHLQPNTAQPFRGDRNLPRPHILVSVWETSRLPASWVSQINGYDQVWCATEWQRAVYEASGVHGRLLRVVPFALDPELYEVQPQTHARQTVFGSVFQWSERKDPGGLIGAYLQAFTAEDPVTLLIKSYEGDNPGTSIVDRVEEIIRSHRLRHRAPRIEVVSRAHDSAAMSAFYRSIDCYVSAHRGEGWSFPISEALLFGKPVIATGWSAPAEYAAGCFRAVRYALEPPHGMDWQPFYTPDQEWARADVIDLAVAMREAHERKLGDFSAQIRERFDRLCALAGASAKTALIEAIR